MLTLSVCCSVSTEAWTQRDTEGLRQESNQSGVVGMKCAAQRLSWTVCLFSRKLERSRCRLLLSCWTVEANYQRRCSSKTHRDGCDAIQYMQKHMQTRARSRVSPPPPPPLSYLFLFINGGWVKAADSSRTHSLNMICSFTQRRTMICCSCLLFKSCTNISF